MDLEKYLEVAITAAYAGGGILRKHWGNLTQVQEKQPGDLVTIADQESETKILEIMQQSLPGHSILAEESGKITVDRSEFLWAIDPLDGTTNFAHQYPFYGVSLGLLIHGVPRVGVVYEPFRDQLFYAASGLGARSIVNNHHSPIQVSEVKTLEQSLLVTGFAYDRRQTDDNNYAEFCHFTHITQGVRRGGSAAIDLAYVACGCLDGYWERGLSLWDIAAGVVLVQEAGGIVTAYDGSPINLKSGRILASNPYLHAPMIRELAKVKPLPPFAWKIDH
ncbi:MAG: inositol monophosphatase family protein [Pseudanabaenaceae cyanobacterium bins.68]|nr:inositol monophosphatase family protein [Pseudanabaenaceae cyanobacterium bins.68]